MKETPGHGADVVEELQGGGCLIAFRGVGEAENPEVDVDLLRGSVGNQVVVEPVSSGTPVAWRPGAPAFWSAAAPAAGVPASPHRRGRAWVAGEDCDRADGTPAACIVAGTAAPERNAARVASALRAPRPTPA